MFDLIGNLGLGFATAVADQSPARLHWMPRRHFDRGASGLGPIATIAMLLPLTFKVDPTGALIMLASIYYGS